MNYGWEIAKIVFYLILITGIIYLLSYPLKRKIGKNSSSKYMKVIDRLYYDTKNSFIILEVGKKMILVAHSEGNAEKIAEWERSEFNTDFSSISNNKRNQKFNFKTQLKKYLQKDIYRDDGNDSNE